MFRKQTFAVYRPSAASGFTDATFTFSHNIQLGYEATGHSDSIMANQNAEIIRGVGYHYGTLMPNLTVKDLLKDAAGNTLKVQSIEPFQNGMIPHYEIYLTDSQWQV